MRWIAPLLFAACSTNSLPDSPGRFVGVPTSTDEADAIAEHARELVARGEDRAALVKVEAALALAPRHVDAHRLRQDVLRRRGRIAKVLTEADERLLEWGGSADALYLRGRLEVDDAEKQGWFTRAIEREPRSFWGWFGLAYGLREDDPDRALRVYRELWEASGRHRTIAASFDTLLRRLAPDAAREVLDRMRERDPWSGAPDLATARTAIARQDRREAWAPTLESLRKRPFDREVRSIVQAFVVTGIADDRVAQILDVLAESAERTRMFVASGGGALLARLFERAGRVPEAREVLVDARPTADVLRQRRRFALASGDVAAFLRALADDLPPSIVDDESNHLRGIWHRVLGGSWARSADPLAVAPQVVGLCAVLVDAGLLAEAATVATLGRLRHLGDAEAVAQLELVRAEARRELAFEGGLRRMLYSGYTSAPVSLSDFLAEVRALSMRVLGKDVVGAPDTFTVPFVGELLDPFGDGLAAHLRRYNRHLILGQRAGQPPEGMMLTRLSVRDLDDGGPLALEGRAFEIIGDDRQIESLQGVLGGDLAGVALLNHYVIDYDAVLDWALSLRERRAVVREDGDRLLHDPLVPQPDPLDPVDVAWRLLALSPVQDSDFAAAILDMVRWHERAHLVDAFRYLPPERNLLRVLGLVVGNGFSAASVEAEMEGRAETAAVAFAAHPELVLAHIASFLEGPGGRSPHAAGFRRLARGLNDLLVREGVPEAGSASSWHRIDLDRVRAAARELASRHWP